jgi:hypothetical protein
MSSPTDERRELIDRLHDLFAQVQADIDRRDKDLPASKLPPSAPPPQSPSARPQA